MDVSGIGGHTPNNINDRKAKIQNPAKNEINNYTRKKINNNKAELGDLVELTSEPVNEKEKEYDNYLSEYYGGLTTGRGIGCLGGDFGGISLEDMYKYSMEQFDEIENSTYDEETKAMRRMALEEALKNSTFIYVSKKLANAYNKIDSLNCEEDKEKQAENRTYNYNQQKAIISGAMKLTLSFLDFIKNNKGSDFETILNYINSSSTDCRDINNLSTKEIEGFFDYLKNTSLTHSQSTPSADFYKGYFTTVSNGIYDKPSINIRRYSAIVGELYHKY